MNPQFTEVAKPEAPKAAISNQNTMNQTKPPTEINPDNITATINEMIKDTNVLSAFELNEKNLQFLKELRKFECRK